MDENELEQRAMSAAEDVTGEHGLAAGDPERQKLLLSLTWLMGYGDGMERGKELADEAFASIARALTS